MCEGNCGKSFIPGDRSVEETLGEKRFQRLLLEKNIAYMTSLRTEQALGLGTAFCPRRSPTMGSSRRWRRKTIAVKRGLPREAGIRPAALHAGSTTATTWTR